MNTDDLALCCECHKLMKNPVWLPCSDAFCHACVDVKGSCPNPKCQKTFVMSSEGVSRYENAFLSRLADVKRISLATETKSQCELCKWLPDNKSLAEYYCMSCHQSLCADCWRRHQHIPLTVNHVILLLGTQLSAELPQEIKAINPQCFAHQGQLADWKCNQCELFICSQCQHKHQSHGMETIDNILQTSRKQIKDTLVRLKKSTSENTKVLLDDQTTRIRSKTQEAKQSAKNSSSMRTRSRWIMFADALLKIGTVTEQLENFMSLDLNERLFKLQKTDCVMSELTADKILQFTTSKNLEQPTLDTMVKSDRADVSSDYDASSYSAYSGICRFPLISFPNF